MEAKYGKDWELNGGSLEVSDKYMELSDKTWEAYQKTWEPEAEYHLWISIIYH